MKTWVVKINTLALIIVFTSIAVGQVSNVPKIGRYSTEALTQMLNAPGSNQILPNSSQQSGKSNPIEFKSNPIKSFKDLPHNKKLEIQKTLEGGIHGGGGDQIALDFQVSFRNGLKELEEILPELFKTVADRNLEQVISQARILILDDVLDLNIRGLIQNSVAVNIPELQVILVNRKRWTNIALQKMRSAIALHEVLSLAQIEQTGYYPISGPYAHLSKNSNLASFYTVTSKIDAAEQFQRNQIASRASHVLMALSNNHKVQYRMTQHRVTFEKSARKNNLRSSCQLGNPFFNIDDKGLEYFIVYYVCQDENYINDTESSAFFLTIMGTANETGTQVEVQNINDGQAG